MFDRKALRLSAVLLLGGFITYVVVTFLHTGGPANNHKVIFDDYARSAHGAARSPSKVPSAARRWVRASTRRRVRRRNSPYASSVRARLKGLPTWPSLP